jgi:ABC-type Fe3+-hydroxamate transport system substrate-binding protein
VISRIFHDQLGREVILKELPQRIVSLVPSQTELLCDLGLGDRVVGITKFCIHPKDWFESKTRIGGTKNVNFDRVKSLQPDLILANKEENTQEDIALLEAIAPVWISDINTVDDALKMIISVGQMMGCELESEKIVEEINYSFSKDKISASQSALYMIWKDPNFCAGKDTFINSMLEKSGFQNICEVERYPEIGTFDMKAPEVVMLSSEPYPFKESDRIQFQTQFPAAKIVFVDGELFSWYGSRMLLAAEYFARLRKEISLQ